MPARPFALTALLATLTLLVAAGAWWAVWPDAPQVAGVSRAESAARSASGPAPAGCGPSAAAQVLGWKASGPERLVAGAGLLASDRVDELITDLKLLRPSVRLAGGETNVVRRLESFVLDVHAADQVAPAGIELERRLDGLPSPQDVAEHAQPGQVRNDWLSARLLIALAGLGAAEPVMARWQDLVPIEQADVLIALGWDPMAPLAAPRLEARRTDGLVRGAPLLPLVLSRLPSGEVVAFLRERLDQPTRGLHGMRGRDAALLVLGIGLGHDPECLALIEESLRADPTGSFVALYTLVVSDDPDARSLLTSLRRRHAPRHPMQGEELARHERFACDLGHVLLAASDEARHDFSTLRDGLLPGRDLATRLGSASGLLARISNGVPESDTRNVLSDLLIASLANERDRDVVWLELFALRQLHIGEAWLPSRTIGYGAEDGLDLARAAQRTSTFLAFLSDPDAATRRLAVFGLLGSTHGRGVESALTAALAAEEDGCISKWMRLALLRL